MKKLVILDRDGVINFDSPDYIKSAEEWNPIPGSIEAIATLKQHGYLIGVATNQAGLAKGLFTQDDLNAMHRKMQTLIEEAGGKIDYLTYCPHGYDDGCNCRKPAPGMLLEIMQALNIPAEQTVFIGDKYSDYQTAVNAGCDFMLVQTGKGQDTLLQHPELLETVAVADSLSEAAERILQA